MEHLNFLKHFEWKFLIWIQNGFKLELHIWFRKKLKGLEIQHGTEQLMKSAFQKRCEWLAAFVVGSVGSVIYFFRQFYGICFNVEIVRDTFLTESYLKHWRYLYILQYDIRVAVTV